MSVEPSAVEPSAVEPSAVEPSAVEPSATTLPTTLPTMLTVLPTSSTSPNQPITHIVTIQPTDLQITNNHVVVLMKAINETLNGHQLTKDNILRVAMNVFRVACSMKDLPTRLQKRVIILALQNIVDQQSDISATDKEMLNLAIQEVVNEAINIAGDIVNGNLALTTKNKSCCVIV